MTAAPHRVAIVGAGIMGRRMMKAMHAHPRFEVVGLFDPRTEAAQGALAIAPTPATASRIARDLDDLVGDPGVDLVYIASPPSSHLDGVRAALAAGHACLCEKPLAADVQEAATLRDLVNAAGLPFAMHFPFASGDAARRMIDFVREGAVVTEARITLRFARWPRPWQADAADWLAGPGEGGFTREVLSHFVFLALQLFGPATVEDVQLVREPGRAETALRARLVHARVDVVIDAALAGEIADRNRFELTGPGGTVALADWSRFEGGGQAIGGGDSLPVTLDRVARMLEGASDHGLATVAEGLAVVRCIERMLES